MQDWKGKAPMQMEVFESMKSAAVKEAIRAGRRAIIMERILVVLVWLVEGLVEGLVMGSKRVRQRKRELILTVTQVGHTCVSIPFSGYVLAQELPVQLQLQLRHAWWWRRAPSQTSAAARAANTPEVAAGREGFTEASRYLSHRACSRMACAAMSLSLLVSKLVGFISCLRLQPCASRLDAGSAGLPASALRMRGYIRTSHGGWHLTV